MERRKKRGREDKQTKGSHWAPSRANTKPEVPGLDKAHPGGQPAQGNKIASHHKCLPASQALPRRRRTSSNYPRGPASAPTSTGTGTCGIHLGSGVRWGDCEQWNHCPSCFLLLRDRPLTRSPKPGPAYTSFSLIPSITSDSYSFYQLYYDNKFLENFLNFSYIAQS